MLFDFLPEELRGKAFIAGGWAACPSLAGDMDVWVTIPIDFDYTSLVKHLKDRQVLYTFDQTMQSAEYTDSIYIGRLIYPWRTVELLLTTYTPQQLIEEFDISTHQIAITAMGQIITGSKWTPVTEPPKLFNPHGPKSDERFVKISERFGFKVEKPRKPIVGFMNWIFRAGREDEVFSGF